MTRQEHQNAIVNAAVRWVVSYASDDVHGSDRTRRALKDAVIAYIEAECAAPVDAACPISLVGGFRLSDEDLAAVAPPVWGAPITGEDNVIIHGDPIFAGNMAVDP